MSDIEIIQIDGTQPISMDFLLLPNGTLSMAEELATAVRIALGSDRLANLDDELPTAGLPNADPNRRGWWGDMDAAEIYGGWPIGIRLWLLSRAKITDANARVGSTIAKVEDYIREALAPLKTLKVASRIDVTASRYSTTGIGAKIMIYRGPLSAIQLNFEPLWDGIRA